MIKIVKFEDIPKYQPAFMSFANAEELATVNEKVLNCLNDADQIYEIISEETLSKRLFRQKQLDKKQKQKNKVTSKEKTIEFNYNCAQHDLDRKIAQAIEFINDDYKVSIKCNNRNHRNVNDADVTAKIIAFAEQVSPKRAMKSYKELTILP